MFGWQYRKLQREIVATEESVKKLNDKAKEMLDAQVRIGKPRYIKGLSNTLHLTTLSTVIGLLLYAQNYRIQKEDKKIKSQSEKTNWLKKVVKWIIQSF